jgi:hypothetical protein
MIIESGLIVAAGLLLTFFKTSWRVRMWILSHVLVMDITVFIVLNILHSGTFSGVMVAATGALVCSGMLSLGRTVFGYTVGNLYFPGWYDVSRHLIEGESRE